MSRRRTACEKAGKNSRNNEDSHSGSSLPQIRYPVENRLKK
jgi:hypothetical protein